VVLDDKRKTWRRVEVCGGLHRSGPRVGAALPKIRELLAERRQRLDDNDPERAQAASAQLERMGVVVDDAARTWSRPRRSAAELQADKAVQEKDGAKKPNWRNRGKAKAMAAKAARKREQAAEGVGVPAAQTAGGSQAAEREPRVEVV